VSPPSATQRCHAGIRFFVAPDRNCYHVVQGIDELKAQPGLKDFDLQIGPGEMIPPLTDFRGRLGHAVFTAEIYDLLKARLMAVDHIISFHG
jgi:hypothetical protein